MNCIFCQGPTVHVPYPRVDEDAERAKNELLSTHYFQNRTCLKCQTAECSLEFNYLIYKDTTQVPELINYRLKYNGFTAWIGIKYPGTEITEDWHKHHNMTTMCHPILMSDNYSMSLTPENFPRRLKTVLVFQ